MDVNSIENVAVIGAGTMGPGIAVIFASHGYNVWVTDIKEEVLQQAETTAETAFGLLRGAGLLNEATVNEGKKRIHYTLARNEAVEKAHVVVEAIPENMELKQAFYREVEDEAPEDAILASNTSGIPITKLGEVCAHSERVIGMHWSNPPHIIPVIEIIRGEQTSQETVNVLSDLVQRIEMIPVEVKRDVPGFIENRVLYAIMREALHLLEDGIASAEDIDKVVQWGIGYKLAVIPPLKLLDVAGLDIYSSVASYLNADLDSRSDVSDLVGEKVDRGELGIKTGKGLFDYENIDVPSLMKGRIQRLLAVRKALSDTNEA